MTDPHPIDKKELSRQLVKLPEYIFALVIAQALVLYREVLIHPVPYADPTEHATAIAALFALIVATILSWYDWHVTMERRPYDMKRGRWDWVNFYADMAVVVAYAYLLMTISLFENQPAINIWQHLIGYPIVFGLYLASGIARRRMYGREASRVSVIIQFACYYAGLVVLYVVLAQRIGVGTWFNVAFIGVFFATNWLYRWLRKRKVATTGTAAGSKTIATPNRPTIGIDIDGVLGDQIAGVIPRVKTKYGIDLTFEQIASWRYSFGPSDIATEIAEALTDPAYVLGMPVHEGAHEVLRQLTADYEVTLMTARPDATREGTEHWLRRNGLAYDTLVNTKEAGKSAHGADILVDDYIGNVSDYLSKTSGASILVRRPWNLRDDELNRFVRDGRLMVVDGLRDIPAAVARLTTASPDATSRQARALSEA